MKYEPSKLAAAVLLLVACASKGERPQDTTAGRPEAPVEYVELTPPSQHSPTKIRTVVDPRLQVSKSAYHRGYQTNRDGPNYRVDVAVVENAAAVECVILYELNMAEARLTMRFPRDSDEAAATFSIQGHVGPRQWFEPLDGIVVIDRIPRSASDPMVMQFVLFGERRGQFVCTGESIRCE